MSSSQPFAPSSQFSSESRSTTSRFTYKQLAQLAASSTASPLRVIAHVDLDAFYAQCEMVRMGVAEDQPLAVQQWTDLIAVNYPARDFGISRMVTATEAKKLCPNLICQHVATWKEGEEKWAYHDDAPKNIATQKAALDPYRLESRRILACIKETLPANLQKIEKAGMDEVFLDLSAHVHSIMLERYPELAGPVPHNDPHEQLPRPPTTALDWQADALIDLDIDETEDDNPDWDDVAILIGSEIVRMVRAAVREKLKYTCSGGIAQNKMIAKLGSAHKKPNQQTVVRNRAVQQFLSDFKFTKIRGLGGKLGEQIAAAFGIATIEELLLVPIEQLQQKLGDDSGTWVYQIIRGNDSSEVNSRTQIKSMLSAKSFRPSINTAEQATRWLRIFVSDIYARLVEEGVLENKRRPKTMNLHYRQGGQTRSRQGPIPQGRRLDEAGLFALSKTLLDQIILEGQVWPCAHLSLYVGGFEDGIVGNMSIGSFLVKGEEAKTLAMNPRESGSSETRQERPGKRRRNGSTTGIGRFFKTNSIDHHQDEPNAQYLSGMDTTPAKLGTDSSEVAAIGSKLSHESEGSETPKQATISGHILGLQQQPITDYVCVRCNIPLESAIALQSHQDWHFAKDLEDEDRVRTVTRPNATTHGKKPTGASSTKKNGRSNKPEKGQSKLTFG
ncbi:putative DNA polymerase kappa [Venustampulla echinocandica]|uniref:DNA polymerase eta n=1 Tax=Venustampulla echinocandica TaxID=2656787 RepID=A0A370U190_9HELO|nr:putative DNA polymerase kappa [Venustampulla echinocandica]RDL41542.1 putative DNA polymerase kappa [Venustampulla echinocandica]